MPKKFLSFIYYIVILMVVLFLAWANWELFLAPKAEIKSGKLVKYYDSLEDDACHVIYVLNGAVNQRDNPDKLYASDEEFMLRMPTKYGYTFNGWYADRHYRNRVDSISYRQEGSIVLYARWTPKIDNAANVENYSYQAKESEENIILLKDCEYGFVNEIDIPGMPSTREDDFLNNYIFSESQCPQGLCFTDEYVILTSYSEESDCLGELMVFDRSSGTYLVTLGMDPKSHLGGITFDGKNIWVCNSAENTIERLSYDFIQLMATENAGSVIDATDVVDIYPVENKPSCITYHNGRLWIATHTIYLNSKMRAYHYDNMSNELTILSEFTLPNQVQGVAFGDDDWVYLSTSYGRSSSSYLKAYPSIVEMSTNPNKPSYMIEMPPCSEEVDLLDGKLYILFESAGEKYLEGTDGRGTSVSPIDKILTISLDSIPTEE